MRCGCLHPKLPTKLDVDFFAISFNELYQYKGEYGLLVKDISLRCNHWTLGWLQSQGAAVKGLDGILTKTHLLGAITSLLGILLPLRVTVHVRVGGI